MRCATEFCVIMSSSAHLADLGCWPRLRFCGQEPGVRASTAGCHGETDWEGKFFRNQFPRQLQHFYPCAPIEVTELDDFSWQRLSAFHFLPFVCWRFENCVNSLIATSACDKDLGSRVQSLPGLIAARRMFCQNHQCLFQARAGPPMMGGHILTRTGISREINSLAHLNFDNTTTLTNPPTPSLGCQSLSPTINGHAASFVSDEP